MTNDDTTTMMMITSHRGSGGFQNTLEEGYFVTMTLISLNSSYDCFIVRVMSSGCPSEEQPSYLHGKSGIICGQQAWLKKRTCRGWHCTPTHSYTTAL